MTFLPKMHDPHLIMRKYQMTQTEDNLLACTLQKCQGQEKQWGAEEESQVEDEREKTKIHAMWMLNWVDPGLYPKHWIFYCCVIKDISGSKAAEEAIVLCQCSFPDFANCTGIMEKNTLTFFKKHILKYLGKREKIMKSIYLYRFLHIYISTHRKRESKCSKKLSTGEFEWRGIQKFFALLLQLYRRVQFFP